MLGGVARAPGALDSGTAALDHAGPPFSPRTPTHSANSSFVGAYCMPMYAKCGVGENSQPLRRCPHSIHCLGGETVANQFTRKVRAKDAPGRAMGPRRA